MNVEKFNFSQVLRELEYRVDYDRNNTKNTEVLKLSSSKKRKHVKDYSRTSEFSLV